MQIAQTGLLIAALSPLMLVDCGGYQPPTLGACGDGTPLDEADCPGASYVAADRCFESKIAACDCLGCPPNRCAADEGSPTSVRCGAPESD